MGCLISFSCTAGLILTNIIMGIALRDYLVLREYANADWAMFLSAFCVLICDIITVFSDNLYFSSFICNSC